MHFLLCPFVSKNDFPALMVGEDTKVPCGIGTHTREGQVILSQRL